MNGHLKNVIAANKLKEQLRRQIERTKSPIVREELERLLGEKKLTEDRTDTDLAASSSN